VIKIEQSAVINRSIEEVFAFVSEIEKWDQWAAELVEVKKTSEGPVGVGTTFTGVVSLLGRRMDNIHEVTEYEPNSKFGLKITSGPVRGGGGISLESVEGGTKLTFAMEVEPGGFFRVAEPLLARNVQRQYETNLATMKDLLEAQT